MSSKTWIYIIILVVVLGAAGGFLWWMYKGGKITPKAEVTPSEVVTQSFEDVAPNYWAYREIEAVNQLGYMQGYPWFKPDEISTRASAAMAVGRAYQKTANPATPSFSDVPTTHMAYQYIEGLKAANILNGYPDGTFRPGNQLIRSELAIYLASAVVGSQATVPDGPATPSFTDVAANHAAYKYIEYCKAHDIMVGYGTEFRPDELVKRSDVAVALARAKAGGDSAVPAATTKSFEDVATDHLAYKYIEYVYNSCNKAMSGWFRPDDFSSRAMVAVVFARAYAGGDDKVPAGPSTASYSDVPTTHWAFKYIEYCKTINIMTGYDDGTFKPDGPPATGGVWGTRRTAATVLARAKGMPSTYTAPTTPSFADVPTTDPQYKEIEWVKSQSYVVGCRQSANNNPPPDTIYYFCPDDNLTRAVLGVFVYNGYKSNPATPTPTPTPTNIVTITPTASVLPTVTPSGTTPVPTSSITFTPTPRTTTTTPGTTTGSAKTGPEIPLASAGLLGGLFLLRYLVGRKAK